MAVDLKELANLVIKGKQNEVYALCQQALAEKIPGKTIFYDGLIVGMGVVIERFKKNEVFIPEVLIAARAMQKGMELVKPLLEAEGVAEVGVVVLGTVKGDLHDIGKNLVAMALRGQGFKVVDAGIDVPPEKFVELAAREKAQIVGCSALLTTTMPQMKNVIEAVKKAGLEVRVMIGGAPVTQQYADEIGADGYAPDAASAVDLARELVGRK